MSAADDIRKRIASHRDNREQPIQRVGVREEPTFRITAGELRAACEANPQHPVAAVYRKAAGNLHDDYPLAVERVDLEALLDNKSVKPVTVVENGVRVTRKQLVDAAPKATRAPRPVPMPTADKEAVVDRK